MAGSCVRVHKARAREWYAQKMNLRTLFCQTSARKAPPRRHRSLLVSERAPCQNEGLTGKYDRLHLDLWSLSCQSCRELYREPSFRCIVMYRDLYRMDHLDLLIRVM